MRSRILSLVRRTILPVGAMLCAATASFALDVGSTGAHGTFNPVKGSPPWDADNDGIVTLRPEIMNLSDARVIDARSGIFNWTSVTIPADVTVVFARDRMTSSTYNPPFQFLSQSSIAIAGVINSNGLNSGGFDSGIGAPGAYDGSISGGRFMGPVESKYTGSEIGFPPTGGAGDQLDQTVNGAGGAGGIVLAANDTIDISGQVISIGGANPYNFDPGGGGGSIRLVATTIHHTGTIETRNGQQGFTGGLQYGALRLEAWTITGNGALRGVMTYGRPGPILYESGGSEPRLFIDRLIDKNLVEVEFPEWDPRNPEVYKPLVLPKTLEHPFTIVVRAENIAEGRQVRVIAPVQTKTGTLAFNPSTSQIEASVVFDGAGDFGTYENINTIYAELIVP